MIVHIAAVSQFNTTQYATGVTWSLPSSTGLTKRAEKRNTIDGQIALAQTWFLKAPGAGTGTVTVTFNVTGGSADCVVLVELWTGVDQTDPVPVGDIVQKDTDETTAVATPTNLVTGDATTGISVETAGGYSAWGPNGLYASGSLPGTVEVYATNTTGLSWTFTGLGHSNHAITAVRIKGAAGGNIAGGLVNTPMLKGLVGGGLVP
jgi:hypothetical protein